MNAGTSYASIAKTVVCSGRGSDEVHVCLDKYVVNSIKDSERQLRGATNQPYGITGPDQKIRQSGQKLLTLLSLTTFLMIWNSKCRIQTFLTMSLGVKIQIQTQLMMILMTIKMTVILSIFALRMLHNQ